MRFFFRTICFLFFKSEYDELKTKIQYNFNIASYEKELLQLNTLIKILMLAEDHRFNRHFGFDIIAIIRAIRNNFFWGRREGASTIEQQLVRVLTNRYEVKLYRKIREILLATTLATVMPRKYIPLYYLKIAYFGMNYYGYEDICKYLSYDVENLGVEESASIVARLKYPEAKRPEIQKNIDRRVLFLIRKYENN